MNRPVALQLYSVRNDAKTDLQKTLARVAEMGYEGVEFAGYYDNEPVQIRKWLDQYGLKAEGCHIGTDALDPDNLQQTMDAHAALGTNWAIVAWLPEKRRATPTDCGETAKWLTELHEKVGKFGIRLGFHAHQADMQPLDGGKSAWYLLAESTPQTFIMQYDTANGMSGGADPVQPILDLPNRGASTHLKEWAGGHGAIIGDGDVPWKRVLEACETVGGTQWYVVEYEIDTDPNPLDSVQKCLHYLRTL